MDPDQRAALAADERETEDLRTRAVIRAKLGWYALSRPFWDLYWRRRLAPRLGGDPDFRRVDRFLHGEGGMFKEYVYERIAELASLRKAKVLVAGTGFGRNLLQLARFGPREIIAFDLYAYPEPWKFLQNKMEERYGVRSAFYEGDFSALPPEHAGTFDVIISDAVLEHVPDMAAFAAASAKFLKKGGIFYASWGPLWYGPYGDHASWGEGAKMYDHLLLSPADYKAQLAAHPQKSADSCDTGFMLETGLFSYLKSGDYFRELDRQGFERLELEAKIVPQAVRALRRDAELDRALDAKGVPAFDRCCGGYYLWARKPQGEDA